jgi:alkylation response protein AidB-like acyl-CoA dehydrogenase
MATVSIETIPAADWISRATAMGPVITEHRDTSEAERKMAQPIFDALTPTGFLEMLVPRAFGGPQASPTTYTRVVEELARFDGSAAWNVLIWGGSGLFADYLPEEAADEVFGAGRRNIVAGAINPTGQARPVPGGYEVRGRWSFGSGCQYATWLIAGCMVMDGTGSPRMLDNGMPDMQAVFLPAADVEIIDTWHTAGLRGTGSHDFRVDAVFVPTARTFPVPLLFAGPIERPSTSCRTPFADIAAPALAVVGLGIARDAIDTFIGLASHKVPAVGTMTLANQHTVQQRVGKAEALVRSAQAYLYTTMDNIATAHAAGAPVTDEDSAAMRLATSYTAQCAVDAVDLIFDAAGGSSIYESNRLERCFRDVHMITHHMMASPSIIEMVGQFLLGGPLQPRR